MLPTTLQDWLALLEQRHPRSIDLGLERCGSVYQRLGSPRPGQTVISVAGTNGKGSALACMDSLGRSLGYRIAVYTSPHLLEFNERLLLDGEAVGDDDLLRAFAEVEEAREAESLTYFEFTTLACLWLMNESNPDIALLEVGLGGRLDTVNLVDADIALIMPVGLDHQQFLGPDREVIGAEKAGILRAGRPVVCGESNPPASVLERARKLDCQLFLPGRDFHCQLTGGGLLYGLQGMRLSLPAPALPGAHQADNFAAALTAFLLAVPSAEAHSEALASGVQNVRLAGRLQTSTDDSRVLLDVGHNPLAALAVAAHLDGLTLRACHCVLGMLADKDAEAVATALGPRVAHWYCSTLESERGLAGEALESRISGVLSGPITSAFDSVGQALEAARQNAGPDDTVLVFGSFETVAAALRALRSRA